MQPIAIAASPLTYTEYRKLSLIDFRVRYPFYYIGLPAITLLPLVVIAAVAVLDGTSSIDWQFIRTPVSLFGIAALIWGATLYSLRRDYRRNSSLRDGVIYRLDERGLAQEGNSEELILWSNIAKTAVQVGKWILLRQVAPTSKEIYFLNTANVMPPAERSELLALLKRKRIRPI